MNEQDLPEKLPLTPRAKLVMESLECQARLRGLTYIGSEVIALTALRIDGVARRALESLGVTVGQFEDAIRTITHTPLK